LEVDVAQARRRMGSRADVGISVRKKIAKYIKRALRLTHKKISSTSGTEPGQRPSNQTEPKCAEKNTELAGSAASKEAIRREEEASSVLRR